MYIRRKAFSVAYNENGEEKLFSTTEIMSEEAYLEKLYSENEEQKEFAEKKKKALKEVEHDKGMKRAFLLSPFDGGGGLVGGYMSKEEADKADEEGASDEEILRRAKKKGLKVGAITGAATGTVLGLANAKRTHGQSLSVPVVHTALGALGGRNAASMNTKARLKKRAENS